MYTYIIGICDDKKEVVDELKKKLEKILSQMKSWEIVCFYTGDELLECRAKLDIVFLDIEMPGRNGLEVGRILKERNPDCKVVISTGLEVYYKQAFCIQAFRFVTKPFRNEELEEALMSAIQEKMSERLIELFYERNSYKIREREIQLIKAFNGYTEFYVGKRAFRKETSLNEVEKMLNEKIFVRISRQYIVNLQWIDNYECGRVFVSSIELHVSRRRRKEFEHRYIEYDVLYRRG